MYTWIDIKEKLPRINKEVIVSCYDSLSEQQWIEVATLVKNDFNEKRWYNNEGWDLTCVTHWMPIKFPKINK